MPRQGSGHAWMFDLWVATRGFLPDPRFAARPWGVAWILLTFVYASLLLERKAVGIKMLMPKEMQK